MVTDKAEGTIKDWIREDLVNHFRGFGIYYAKPLGRGTKSLKVKKLHELLCNLDKEVSVITEMWVVCWGAEGGCGSLPGLGARPEIHP